MDRNKFIDKVQGGSVKAIIFIDSNLLTRMCSAIYQHIHSDTNKTII